MTSGGLKNRNELTTRAVAAREASVSVSAVPHNTEEHKISGVSLSRGLALGHAVLYAPHVADADILADDPAAQIRRLRAAAEGMHVAIDRMLHHNATPPAAETRDILEAYQMFARDRGWLASIEQAIQRGLSAEAAVHHILEETRTRMTVVKDVYIRERLHDIEDLSHRLLSHLKQHSEGGEQAALPEEIILVAQTLGPAALLDYGDRLKGVVLEKGGYSNHVAIVARSLGIPVVGQCEDALRFARSGDHIIVDGDRADVYLRPSQYEIELYTRSLEARAHRTHMYRNLQQQNQPSVTKDGVKVSVQMNAGFLSEIPSVLATGAEGIGLFRTELTFMGWKKYPLVVTQAELYGKVMDRLGDKPVTFRTLDIGGDKPLPYFQAPFEENPALGWRAVRIGMDRPAVLRTQFRAFIRGSKGRDLRIMLPMVAEVAEYDRARAFLEMEKDRARNSGIPVPEKIELGVMLEVPALLWQLETLLQTADFVSVGTNDLIQYLFAADRGNDSMRRRYDPLSPAMLRVLKTIADQCRAAGVPVSVCGEMAGHPLEAMVLVVLGYQSLSVTAPQVEAVKMMIPTLDTGLLLPYLEQLMKSREHSLRERLLSFAHDHRVHITQDI